MKNVVLCIVGSTLLVTAGIAAGWYVGSPDEPHVEVEAPDPHAGHQHAEDEPHADEPDTAGGDQPLSAQALQNLGVTVAKVSLSDFVLSVRVQASVVDAPLNARPVTTELGGIVTELHVRPGQSVRPGTSLATLTRTAIPRPELPLVGALLPSLSEDLHDAVASYRNAITQRKIVNRELERVRRFTDTGTTNGLPILPRKTQIDLEYDLARAEQGLTNARREIERHGLTSAEIDALPRQGAVVANDVLWRRALAANGFWSEREDAVLAALPERLRRTPWVVGGLGELAAAGRSGDDLATVITATPALRDRFVEGLSLLLAGHSVAHVRLIAERGELEPVVSLRAPDGPPDWDVESIAVQPGQRVEAGAIAVVLHDARTMWIHVEPIGEEVAAVIAAFVEAVPLSAAPLLTKAGPELTGLTVDRLAIRGGRGTGAYIVCRNAPLETSGPTGTRTWGLREGLQYVVSVPATRMPQRFVLPAEAVVQQGAERVVLVQDGDAFVSHPVHVEYEDADVAVIANDGALEAGDPVAVTGAFALSLAQQGSPAADRHAGHGHD